MTVEPGRQLAGRYRVEDLLAERAGARMWRAVDEVLRRSVAIDVLPSDAPRASALVQAARRSAVVTDGRFLRVLDAAEENGDVYVVREWAPGESLDLVLAHGPLTHRRAAWVVHEVAAAVSAAHNAGIYHLRLTPENVLVTDTGGVKIIGLATDAALYGVRHADAEAEDVRALGRLLYAATVAKWPGGPQCELPDAPFEHGRLLRPRQVRAGVPRPIDEVCDRILGDPPRHGAEPLRHAGAVAAELGGTARLATDAMPQHDPEQTQAVGSHAVGGPARRRGPDTSDQRLAPPRSLRAAPAPADATADAGTDATATQPTATEGPEGTQQIPATTAPIASPAPAAAAPTTWGDTPGGDRAAGDRAAGDRARAGGARRRQPPAAPPPDRPTAAPVHRDRPRRAWLWVGLAVAVAGLAVASFLLGLNSSDDGRADRAAPPTPNATTPASNLLRPVGVASVTAFDPFGEEGENSDQAPLVLDDDPSTEWTTLSYEGDPEFGGLKPGLGLILDLGKPTSVARVALGVEGSGTDLEVRAAPPEVASQPLTADAFRTVGSAHAASGRTVIQLDRPVSTRYLLVWLTELPPEESASTYQGRISEITVEG